MQPCIGIRREDKSRWERRVPVTPEDARSLKDRHGVEVYVQPSPNRAFSEDEFRAAGAVVQEDLSPCSTIFGVKEIPLDQFEPGKTYVFFAHVIKGQPYNMPMLQRMLDLGCNLIDYEKIADDRGRRLIFFGRFAGIAGMLETLWALGQRLAWEGAPTPLAAIRHPHTYRDLAEATTAVAKVGAAIRAEGLPEAVTPLVIGVTGYGNVAHGAWEILDLLSIEQIEPEALAALIEGGGPARNAIYAVTFREEHMVEPTTPGGPFDCQRYFDCPEDYRSIFERYLPYLTVIVNGIYWDERYPRLVTRDSLRALYSGGTPRLKVIGDISCDIEGSIECTVRATEEDAPVYVYNPFTGETTDGYAGAGPVVMAVDILPAELPRDASAEFSAVLAPFIPAIARTDFRAPFEQLDLPAEIKRAVIVHQGALAPDYRYIEQYL
ncbi:MAG: hypothetical protein CVU38_05270 [Chloroflexi bacterium HGW-Chloroflexi-1]|nr:MAG: hypothetical protein CVU38_05270 [Chloroflexi bacterium HGW-Chloroflexi-1]